MNQLGEPIFGEVRAHVHEKRSFNIPVSGTLDIRVTETITISPTTLMFSFSRVHVLGGAKPPWDNAYPVVQGPRRLLDGSLSDKSIHEQAFYMDKKTPQWIIDQVEKYRPKDEA